LVTGNKIEKFIDNLSFGSINHMMRLINNYQVPRKLCYAYDA